MLRYIQEIALRFDPRQDALSKSKSSQHKGNTKIKDTASTTIKVIGSIRRQQKQSSNNCKTQNSQSPQTRSRYTVSCPEI